MNQFDRLLNDSIYVSNNTGKRSGPYKTRISQKGSGFTAVIMDSSFDVEEGWKIIRELPNSKEEIFTVVQSHFNAGAHLLPPTWNLTLRKDGSMANQPKPQPSTTINISNSQGIQIGDHNVQHIVSSITGLIEKIEDADAPPADKAAAKSLLRDLMSNPVVASVLGAATSGILGLLGA